MKDEPIYYINQFSVFKRPKIWSKRDYWIFQLVGSIITIPILVLVLTLEPVQGLTFIVLFLLFGGLGVVYNFRRGRQRADRYKMELATGGPTIFYGKYPLNEVAHLRRW